MSRVTDYQFWLGQAVSHFNPLGLYQYGLFPVRYFHGYRDPTAFHLPVVWDNRERPLFKTVGRFHFADGNAFGFRGDKQRTLNNKERTLADSNERQRKGLVPTYAFARDYGGLVGRFKLDWILVKPFIRDSRLAAQGNLFAHNAVAETTRKNPSARTDHRVSSLSRQYFGPIVLSRHF